jgi:competence protein ComEC
MGIRVNRPIIWVTGSYIIGIVIGLNIKWSLNHFFISLIFIALMVGLAKLKCKGLYLPLFLSLFILGGITNTYTHSIPDRYLDDIIGQTVTINGQVLEIAQETDSKTAFILKSHWIKGKDTQYNYEGKIRVTVYYSSDKNKRLPIKPGYFVETRGEIEKPQGRRNPKGFDYRAYLARRDIYYTIAIQSRNMIFIEPGQFSWPKSWINYTSSYLAKVFDTYVGGRGSKLLKAMIIGERWVLPSEIVEEFAITGIAHILAISGLHIGFVVLMLLWLFDGLRLSPRAIFLLQSIALVLYSLIVGGNASVVRATIMTLILLGGRVVGRKPDPLNSLSLAAFVILIFKPLDILEVGFQLSFAAVAGIIMYNKHINAGLSKLFKINLNPLAIILSAQLGTWPLIAYYFNIFSLMGYIANLILVPMAGVIVMLGLILTVFAAIIPLLAKVLGWWLWMICNLLIDVNQWLSSFSWASFRVISPGILFMVIYYLILLILSHERPNWIKKPYQLSGTLIIILLMSIALNPILNNDFKVIFVDVGQGDCIYIKTPDEKHILIDGGGNPSGMDGFDVGAEIVVPFLLKNGISKLDLVAMSHCHDDHIGGLITVIEDLKVREFMEFPPREPSDKYRTLKELVDKKDITYIQAVGGQTYRIGKEVYIDIIYPTEDSEVLDRLYEQNENNLSLVMRIRYQDTDILLTGDIEKGVESYLSEVWEQDVAILKVAHHGSKTSTTAKWLNNIRPCIAIIQSGKNSFGHPDPSVLNRLKECETKVFRNDISGAITCTYNKGEWRIISTIKE